MEKNFLKLIMILALAAVICLPGMAAADYVQGWTENGVYLDATQTWNKMEIFLLTPGNWTGTGVTFTESGWSASLINPGYALATGPLYDPTISGNFNYTTSSTDRTDPYTWDMFLWLDDKIVGVQRSVYSPTGGWSYTDLTADPPSENRSHVPLPPTLLLLGSALVGLGLLRQRKGSAAASEVHPEAIAAS